MAKRYKEIIAELLARTPFKIDPDIEVKGRVPTMANSMFLTNKEQGDWAERIIFNAINENLKDYQAVKYGRSESLAAGDPGFTEFYQHYQAELNQIGKKPDILIFKTSDIRGAVLPEDFDLMVSKAVAALEVRSSSFLARKYSRYMDSRTEAAIRQCRQLRAELLKPPYSELLNQKNPELFKLLQNATDDTFRELDFRLRTWSSTRELQALSKRLRLLKEQIRILHKRDYLSITPKIEDLVLVNRWIQNFNVPHFYLQVFFDKAYLISFQKILKIASDPDKEGSFFFIERDVKNQQKTTIKINVEVGKEILGRIDMPQHRSQMKELERGRLLFYVTFQNGKGYLDEAVFRSEILS